MASVHSAFDAQLLEDAEYEYPVPPEPRPHRAFLTPFEREREPSLCFQTRKVTYYTRHSAQRSKRRAVRELGHAMAVYRCLFCGHYHLTSQTQRSRA